MPDQPTTAFLVVLAPHATDNDASILRTMLRRDPAVANVSPVTQNPAHELAQQRAKAELRAELTPIFAGLVEDVKGTLDATTEELVKITSADLETPVDISREAAKLPRPQVVPPPPAPGPQRGAQGSRGAWQNAR